LKLTFFKCHNFINTLTLGAIAVKASLSKMSFNPHALYVNCDGAMDYDKNNFGGVGILIRFPESAELNDIIISIGRYQGANIERIEMEALTEAMKAVLELFTEYRTNLRNVKQVIFVTDRFGLCDSERSNAFLIKSWRANGWKNYEGKPIKSLVDR
jgi:ribonuclease HI